MAIEARVCAEDPEADFLPAPGEIAVFDPALGPRVRVDSGVAAGCGVPPDFDSLIAKVIAERRHARGGPRAPRLRARRLRARGRGRRHQQGLPDRPARDAGVPRRELRHRVARPLARAAGGLATSTPWRRWSRRRSSPTSAPATSRGGPSSPTRRASTPSSHPAVDRPAHRPLPRQRELPPRGLRRRRLALPRPPRRAGHDGEAAQQARHTPPSWRSADARCACSTTSRTAAFASRSRPTPTASAASSPGRSARARPPW